MVGSPGSGKTMLAQRLPGLLPPLDRAVSLAATMVHSAAGLPMPARWADHDPAVPGAPPHQLDRRPRRRRLGDAAARGDQPRPRWRAVPRRARASSPPAALDGLREPLEEGVIRVSRAHTHAVLPARFLLVAATNPCPCGGGPPGWCECDDLARLRYLRRLSGPLLDRFDLRVAVQRPGVDELLDPGGGEPSAVVAGRVRAARAVALERSGRLNAQLDGAGLDEFAPLTPAAPGRAAGRDRAGPADRARVPPHPPGRPHDRRPARRPRRPGRRT